MDNRNLYIIAGCNGAGKTTASFTILPEIINCKEFVTADEIAKGISPFQPEKVPIGAGRIMINRISEFIKSLFEIFLSEVHRLVVFDNSTTNPDLIARKNKNGKLEIINRVKFRQIKDYYEKHR